MVVNKEGSFVMQRQCPTMALISPRLEIGGTEEVILHLSAPGMSDISVKEPPADTPSEQVRYCMDVLYSVPMQSRFKHGWQPYVHTQ